MMDYNENALQVEMGRRLRSVREEQRWKAVDIADKMGVSKTAVSNWESGKHAPDILNFIKLCLFYKVSPNYFLVLSDDRRLGMDKVSSFNRLFANKTAGDNLGTK